MFYRKKIFTLSILFITVTGFSTILVADYYKPEFFPIGLTGLNYTGSSIPYGNVYPYPWTWDQEPRSEKALIFDLGVNCLGCEDAYHYYLISFTSGQNNYMHKVCIPSFSDTTVDSILLIPVTYCVTERWVLKYVGPCNTWDSFTVEHKTDTTHIPASVFFRSPHRPEYAGWGDPLFTAYLEDYDDMPPDSVPDEGWGCHGSRTDNWEYEGNVYWDSTADNAIAQYENYFSTASTDELASIWGWNLITEGPAGSRHDDYNQYPNDPWRGCWGAVDKIFTGFRQAENGTDHMIVAKLGTSTLHRGGYNIFESQYLPDLDALMLYSHWWCRPYWNYGEQAMFDRFVYGDSTKPEKKGGIQNTAIYFQQNDLPSNRRPGQKRRWFQTIDLAWYAHVYGKKLGSRRPCPPEIRCACYLTLSRGAKGIFFHAWSFGVNPGVYYDNIQVPTTDSIPFAGNVGMRDQLGYPFGDSNSGNYGHHYLNSSAPQAPYWSQARDNTYPYLKDTLIPEIKAISGVLMQLEWENAYSLKTTCGKDTFCPLGDYVDSVTTTDSGYIDLGFFSPYYWQDQGKYLMVVNRDGIADNQPDTITLYLDFDEGDSLYVIEFGDPDIISYLPKSGDGRFHLTREFAPGEGKLFRIEEYV
jgi:hypothetical protein